jgi:hypothetical protein
MPDALPIAEVVHAMEGRTRLRIPARRGDAAFFASIATGLSTIAGVEDADVRPLTGSLLLQHGVPLAGIAAAAEQARLFKVADGAAMPPPQVAARIDPKWVIGVGLGVIAVWQLTQGRILPPAITLAWYGAHLTGLLASGDSADAGE